ncbi:hypothetical protein JW752_01630 [Candidatus Peregrinibacteria bacterium]|nr:hypothetical protein [Candidatus Peregrinibacteria bacterium]
MGFHEMHARAMERGDDFTDSFVAGIVADFNNIYGIRVDALALQELLNKIREEEGADALKNSDVLASLLFTRHEIHKTFALTEKGEGLMRKSESEREILAPLIAQFKAELASTDVSAHNEVVQKWMNTIEKEMARIHCLPDGRNLLRQLQQIRFESYC